MTTPPRFDDLPRPADDPTGLPLSWCVWGPDDQVGTLNRITDATVKSHLVHIFTKLGVTSRTAAVAAGRSAGIVR